VPSGLSIPIVGRGARRKKKELSISLTLLFFRNGEKTHAGRAKSGITERPWVFASIRNNSAGGRRLKNRRSDVALPPPWGCEKN